VVSVIVPVGEMIQVVRGEHLESVEISLTRPASHQRQSSGALPGAWSAILHGVPWTKSASVSISQVASPSGEAGDASAGFSLACTTAGIGNKNANKRSRNRRPEHSTNKMRIGPLFMITPPRLGLMRMNTFYAGISF